jgi:hypothetical protein
VHDKKFPREGRTGGGTIVVSLTQHRTNIAAGAMLGVGIDIESAPMAGQRKTSKSAIGMGEQLTGKASKLELVAPTNHPILRDHLRLSRGELTYSLASLRYRENQMVALTSVFVVDPMNQLASEKALSIAKFEPGLYEAAVRTLIRLVTKRPVRRTKRAHTHSPRGIDYFAGSKRQISSTNLALFKDWCSGIWRDSLKMSEVASSGTACGR